jgi:protocatechuate 3,4-dioxygenase beta subunit
VGGAAKTRSVLAARNTSASAVAPWWEVPGVVLRPLAGRVVATDGTAIAGATVQLYGWGAQVSGVPEATLTTDATGAFRFSSPRNATIYRLVATAPGFAGQTGMADPRAPAHEQDPERVVIALEQCAATVEGFVTDSGGGPIMGASVSTASDSPFIGPATTTNAEGRYSLCLASEDSTLIVGADGYEHVMRSVDAHGRQRVDVALAPGGVLSGRVIDAESGDPVANAQVFVASKLAAPRPTLSAADGTFEIDGIAGDTVNLNVWAAHHVYPEVFSISVIAGQRRDGIEIKLAPGLVVRGIVRANGKPLAYASIRFDSPTRFGPMTALRSISGPDGQFVAINVARCDGVTVRVDGAEVKSPSVIDTRQLAGDLVIEVHEQPLVRGRVVRHGVPVAGAKVVVTAARGSRTPSVPQTRTDAAGAFELPAPPGAFALTAQSKATGSATSRATIVANAAEPVVLDLDAGAVIEGRVLDQRGAPMAGFEVSTRGVAARGGPLPDAPGAPSGFVGSAADGRTTTDAEGRFAIDQLAPGDYELVVAVGRNAPPLAWVGEPSRSIALVSGDARVRDVRLVVAVERTTIAGTLVDLAGAPVTDALVRASGASTRSDADGRFALQLVGPGPFTLEALVGGQRLARRDVDAGAHDVTLRLER